MSETKEWTLMFYFASDNPLAPSVVSQLKALKNAGFHPEANVIAQFDPHTVNTPSHTFDVNLVPKRQARAELRALEILKVPDDHEVRRWLDARHGHRVGFRANDPFIRNLVLDKLWGEATIPNGGGAGEKIKDGIREKIRSGVERLLSGNKEKLGLTDKTIREVIASEGLVEYDPPDPDAHDLPAGAPDADALGAASGDAADGRAEAPGGVEAEAPAGDASKKRGAPGEGSPKDDLGRFLRFCAKNYRARHYMLFIIGHGLVVGNDTFLFDAHAEKPSLSLKDLGDTLDDFNSKHKTVGDLEMVGFHSCSMSSIEVAYELQGKARYMLASQGPEFVGSWPYTQILVRVLNGLVRAEKRAGGIGEEEVKKTVKNIFSYCFYNSYDFHLAGYSFDLALCDLGTVSAATVPIKELAAELMAALGQEDGAGGDEFLRGLILLAHWDAQSFWGEIYTDLYDFCLCLYRRCESALRHASDEMRAKLESIQRACVGVMSALRVGGPVVLRAGFTGPSYQYSHGLSVYFPWSEPGNKEFWPDQYTEYKFGQETRWDEFLQRYFDSTMRSPRRAEPGHEQPERLPVNLGDGGAGSGSQVDEEPASLDEKLLEGITANVFEKSEAGQLGKGGGSDALGKGGGSDATGKGGGSDASGDDCDCPPIKNYPSFTRARRAREKDAGGKAGGGAYARPTSYGLSEGGEDGSL